MNENIDNESKYISYGDVLHLYRHNHLNEEYYLYSEGFYDNYLRCELKNDIKSNFEFSKFKILPYIKSNSTNNLIGSLSSFSTSDDINIISDNVIKEIKENSNIIQNLSKSNKIQYNDLFIIVHEMSKKFLSIKWEESISQYVFKLTSTISENCKFTIQSLFKYSNKCEYILNNDKVIIQSKSIINVNSHKNYSICDYNCNLIMSYLNENSNSNISLGHLECNTAWTIHLVFKLKNGSNEKINYYSSYYISLINKGMYLNGYYNFSNSLFKKINIKHEVRSKSCVNMKKNCFKIEKNSIITENDNNNENESDELYLNNTDGNIRYDLNSSKSIIKLDNQISLIDNNNEYDINHKLNISFNLTKANNTISLSPFHIFTFENIKKNKPFGGPIYWTDRFTIKNYMTDNYILIKKKEKLSYLNKNILKESILNYKIISTSSINRSNYEDLLFILEKNIPEKDEKETFYIKNTDCFNIKHYKTGLYLSINTCSSNEMNQTTEDYQLMLTNEPKEIECFIFYKIEDDYIWEVQYVKSSYKYMNFFIYNTSYDEDLLVKIIKSIDLLESFCKNKILNKPKVNCDYGESDKDRQSLLKSTGLFEILINILLKLEDLVIFEVRSIVKVLINKVFILLNAFIRNNDENKLLVFNKLNILIRFIEKSSFCISLIKEIFYNNKELLLRISNNKKVSVRRRSYYHKDFIYDKDDKEDKEFNNEKIIKKDNFHNNFYKTTSLDYKINRNKKNNMKNIDNFPLISIIISKIKDYKKYINHNNIFYYINSYINLLRTFVVYNGKGINQNQIEIYNEFIKTKNKIISFQVNNNNKLVCKIKLKYKIEFELSKITSHLSSKYISIISSFLLLFCDITIGNNYITKEYLSKKITDSCIENMIKLNIPKQIKISLCKLYSVLYLEQYLLPFNRPFLCKVISNIDNDGRFLVSDYNNDSISFIYENQNINTDSKNENSIINQSDQKLSKIKNKPNLNFSRQSIQSKNSSKSQSNLSQFNSIKENEEKQKSIIKRFSKKLSTTILPKFKSKLKKLEIVEKIAENEVEIENEDENEIEIEIENEYKNEDENENKDIEYNIKITKIILHNLFEYIRLNKNNDKEKKEYYHYSLESLDIIKYIIDFQILEILDESKYEKELNKILYYIINIFIDYISNTNQNKINFQSIYNKKFHLISMNFKSFENQKNNLLYIIKNYEQIKKCVLNYNLEESVFINNILIKASLIVRSIMRMLHGKFLSKFMKKFYNIAKDFLLSNIQTDFVNSSNLTEFYCVLLMNISTYLPNKSKQSFFNFINKSYLHGGESLYSIKFEELLLNILHINYDKYVQSELFNLWNDMFNQRKYFINNLNQMVLINSSFHIEIYNKIHNFILDLKNIFDQTEVWMNINNKTTFIKNSHEILKILTELDYLCDDEKNLIYISNTNKVQKYILSILKNMNISKILLEFLYEVNFFLKVNLNLLTNNINENDSFFSFLCKILSNIYIFITKIIKKNDLKYIFIEEIDILLFPLILKADINIIIYELVEVLTYKCNNTKIELYSKLINLIGIDYEFKLIHIPNILRIFNNIIINNNDISLIEKIIKILLSIKKILNISGDPFFSYYLRKIQSKKNNNTILSFKEYEENSILTENLTCHTPFNIQECYQYEILIWLLKVIFEIQKCYFIETSKIELIFGFSFGVELLWENSNYDFHLSEILSVKEKVYIIKKIEMCILLIKYISIFHINDSRLFQNYYQKGFSNMLNEIYNLHIPILSEYTSIENSKLSQNLYYCYFKFFFQGIIKFINDISFRIFPMNSKYFTRQNELKIKLITSLINNQISFVKLFNNEIYKYELDFEEIYFFIKKNKENFSSEFLSKFEEIKTNQIKKENANHSKNNKISEINELINGKKLTIKYSSLSIEILWEYFVDILGNIYSKYKKKCIKNSNDSLFISDLIKKRTNNSFLNQYLKLNSMKFINFECVSTEEYKIESDDYYIIYDNTNPIFAIPDFLLLYEDLFNEHKYFINMIQNCLNITSEINQTYIKDEEKLFNSLLYSFISYFDFLLNSKIINNSKIKFISQVIFGIFHYSFNDLNSINSSISRYMYINILQEKIINLLSINSYLISYIIEKNNNFLYFIYIIRILNSFMQIYNKDLQDSIYSIFILKSNTESFFELVKSSIKNDILLVLSSNSNDNELDLFINEIFHFFINLCKQANSNWQTYLINQTNNHNSINLFEVIINYCDILISHLSILNKNINKIILCFDFFNHFYFENENKIFINKILIDSRFILSIIKLITICSYNHDSLFLNLDHNHSNNSHSHYKSFIEDLPHQKIVLSENSTKFFPNCKLMSLLTLKLVKFIKMISEDCEIKNIFRSKFSEIILNNLMVRYYFELIRYNDFKYIYILKQDWFDNTAFSHTWNELFSSSCTLIEICYEVLFIYKQLFYKSLLTQCQLKPSFNSIFSLNVNKNKYEIMKFKSRSILKIKNVPFFKSIFNFISELIISYYKFICQRKRKAYNDLILHCNYKFYIEKYFYNINDNIINSLSLFNDSSGMIEIIYNNKYVEVQFPILPICYLINDKLRIKFIENIRRDSIETKLLDLINSSKEYYTYINYSNKYKNIEKKSKFFYTLYSNVNLWKEISFLISFIINIIIIISFSIFPNFPNNTLERQAFGEDRKEAIRLKYPSILGFDDWDYFINVYYIFRIFGVLQFLNSLFISTYNILEIVIPKYKIIKSEYIYEELIRDSITSKINMREKYHHHFINYIFNLRQSFISPIRSFYITFKSIFWSLYDYETFYYFISLVISILGILKSELIYIGYLISFTFKYPILKTLIKSFYMSRSTILISIIFYFYLTYLFSIFIFRYYYEDVKVKEMCDSLYKCFFNLMNIGTKVDDPWLNQKEELYTTRLLFDNLYIYIVVLIWLVVFPSLIIDSFKLMSYEYQKKLDDIQNVCLICGVNRRDVYKDNFEDHINEKHNYWLYIYYIIYILDLKERNIIENIIYDKIMMSEIDWIPQIRLVN